MQHHDPKEGCRRLLDWNRQHLTASSSLDEADIARVFAADFTVNANGRTYQANHRTYLEFLKGFRRDIRSIDYDVHRTVAEAFSVVVAMAAHVIRLDGRHDSFEAMLLLEFDPQGLLTLWHEVYVATTSA